MLIENECGLLDVLAELKELFDIDPCSVLTIKKKRAEILQMFLVNTL